MRNSFRCFNGSPEVNRLAAMMYIRYPLSLWRVEDLLFERGIDICHETVRFWLDRFGPMFAAAIRKRRVVHRSYSCRRRHLDEAFVWIDGEAHYLWRAVDHEGEALEVLATKRRDRGAALKFLRSAMAKFLGFKTSRKFASGHASIHNRFNLERRLDRREIFKRDRPAALAEWRQLAAQRHRCIAPWRLVRICPTPPGSR